MNIDQLFREGLCPSKQVTAFNPDNWAIIEQRLEAQRRKRLAVRARTYSGIAALFLLILSLWLFRPGRQLETGMNTAEGIRRTTMPDKRPAGVEQPSIGRHTDGHPPFEMALIPHKKAQKAIDRYILPGLLPRTVKIQADTPELLSKVSALPALLEISDDLHAYRTQPSAIFSTVEARDPRPSLGVILSLAFAPSLNGVTQLGNAKAGSDVGIIMSFGLTKRWKASTGALISRKRYETDFSHYNLPDQIRFHYDPQRVYADCRILDIPLNFSYSLTATETSSLSIGGGLSSYLMLREDYRYTYARPNSVDPASVRFSNENRHWLSVANLNISYERKLSVRTGISIEPFIKIPVTGVGFAKIDLRSAGMAVHLNWNLKKIPFESGYHSAKIH